MTCRLSLLSFAVAILSAALHVLAESSPKVVGLDFTRELNSVARRNGGLRRRNAVTADLHNAQGDLLYLVNVTVGTSPQPFSLQIDTGSSDVWLPWAGASTCTTKTSRCKTGAFDETKSSTYKLLDAGSFLISYVDGTRIKGDYISDTFGVGSAHVPDMTMGLAKTATEQDTVSDFQGIIGLGFESGEAIYGQTGQTYKNIMTMLKGTGNINVMAYSLWLNDMANGKGSILFGGVDTEKYRGDLTILPIQPDARTGQVSSFTVALDSFNVIGSEGKNQYSKGNLSMPVILDSGTTLTYLPDNIAQDLYTGVGASSSASYGVVVPCDLMLSPATFNFGFGNAKGPVIVASIAQFVLPFPSDVPTPHFKASGKAACRWGIQAAQGRPNLFGDTFLRAAYVVYNLENNEIGIGNTIFNATKSNVKEISVAKVIPGATSTAAGVVAKQTATGLYQPSGSFRTGAGGSPLSSATATFNLGNPKPGSTGSSSSSPRVKGAGAHVQPPSTRTFTIITGVGTLLAFLGCSMIAWA